MLLLATPAEMWDCRPAAAAAKVFSIISLPSWALRALCNSDLMCLTIHNATIVAMRTAAGAPWPQSGWRFIIHSASCPPGYRVLRTVAVSWSVVRAARWLRHDG